MADQPQPAKLSRRRGVRLLVGFVLVAILVVGIWLWWTAGRESTDDAQVDAHVTPIAARVAGTAGRRQPAC
jgi:multidrug resistance efflux pump